MVLSNTSLLPTTHHLHYSSPSRSFPTVSSIGILASAVVLTAAPPPSLPSSEETLANIPTELSSGESCETNSFECKKTRQRIQRPKSSKAERCTSKCVTTCTRGGDGEGPLNLRGPIVVFKQGFRSRQYCLVECSDICNLLDDADKGR